MIAQNSAHCVNSLDWSYKRSQILEIHHNFDLLFLKSDVSWFEFEKSLQLLVLGMYVYTGKGEVLGFFYFFAVLTRV